MSDTKPILQVRDLRVQVGTEVVRLTGHCNTYYAKQKAQHGAMRVVLRREVVNEIEVT